MRTQHNAIARSNSRHDTLPIPGVWRNAHGTTCITFSAQPVLCIRISTTIIGGEFTQNQTSSFFGKQIFFFTDYCTLYGMFRFR